MVASDDLNMYHDNTWRETKDTHDLNIADSWAQSCEPLMINALMKRVDFVIKKIQTNTHTLYFIAWFENKNMLICERRSVELWRTYDKIV